MQPGCRHAAPGFTQKVGDVPSDRVIRLLKSFPERIYVAGSQVGSRFHQVIETRYGTQSHRPFFMRQQRHECWEYFVGLRHKPRQAPRGYLLRLSRVKPIGPVERGRGRGSGGGSLEPSAGRPNDIDCPGEVISNRFSGQATERHGGDRMIRARFCAAVRLGSLLGEHGVNIATSKI